MACTEIGSPLTQTVLAFRTLGCQAPNRLMEDTLSQVEGVLASADSKWLTWWAWRDRTTLGQVAEDRGVSELQHGAFLEASLSCRSNFAQGLVTADRLGQSQGVELALLRLRAKFQRGRRGRSLSTCLLAWWSLPAEVDWF